MTSPAQTADDLLGRALDADRRLWDLTDRHPGRWLNVRNQAVRAAIIAGHTREELATVLQVRPADIDRMAMPALD